MKIKQIGLSKIEGALAVLEAIPDVSFDEIVEFNLENGETRTGKVVELNKEYTVVQVFEGTKDLSLSNTVVEFKGKSLEIPLSKEMFGRVFNGLAKPIDGLGPVYCSTKANINGRAINPVSREYPRSFVQTGISAIDCLCTVIRGQKLPIFSSNGMPHDKLAIQIASQARISSKSGQDFCVIFVAMGVKHDVANFFKESLEHSGAIERSVMFINTSSDPTAERILAPRAALTAAEYLAFTHDMHVLVIMTDMTSYAEALREISSSRQEIPSRKGYPGYLYSDLASLYERAGIIKGHKGSVTQLPILTMPNDDITHPIPDLTGYITEGQIVLDRKMYQQGIYPPLSVLPSLSRLMKDGIGERYTQKDHPELANQLFSAYAEVQEVKALSSIIGEDELSETGKKYIKFSEIFEKEFIRQEPNENRSINSTLEIGWKALRVLPIEKLDRLSKETIQEKFPPENEN